MLPNGRYMICRHRQARNVNFQLNKYACGQNKYQLTNKASNSTKRVLAFVRVLKQNVMKKYKLIWVSEFAERFLCMEDLETLKEMIGSTLTESDIKSNVDGKSMFIMPDGEDTHISFLKLEEMQPELNFEN